LAVAGYNNSSSAICFDENTRDFGQRFRSPYEKTKLEAERLVHEYALRGARALTYRTGNVTAHSVTGKFQRNAKENQFVQLLIALSQLGEWPAKARYDVVLSPVNIVARAMTGISLDAACASGTYHVDSLHTFDVRRLFSAMERHGVAQASYLHGSLAQFLEQAKSRSREAALAHFWFNRPAQNVSFDHSRTDKVLARLGDRFEALDDGWADAFISHLIHTGTLTRNAREFSGQLEDLAL
jgi:thioester reductase-like protein